MWLKALRVDSTVISECIDNRMAHKRLHWARIGDANKFAVFQARPEVRKSYDDIFVAVSSRDSPIVGNYWCIMTIFE